MENLIFSLNTVLPVFLLGVIGYLLAQKGVITQDWAKMASAACFKLFLPVMLFNEVRFSNILNDFDVKFVVLEVGGIVLTMVASCVVWPLFVKDKARCGAVAHSSFRSNFVLFGIPILANMYSSEAMASATALLPFAVVTFNICAVVCFSVFAPQGEGAKKVSAGSVIMNVFKNPFIIATALGAIALALNITFPSFANKLLSNISSMASPLVLLCVGAQFDFAQAMKNIRISSTVSIVRLFVVPGVMVAAFAALGYRGAELATLYVLYGSPTATSGAAMAANMGSDSALTGEITLISSVLCVVSYFFGILIMKSFSLI